jgi:membrane associated rhomboid family serine protease
MTPWVVRLLLLNGLVFLLSNILGYWPIYAFGVYDPAAVLVRPWTLVTYMFLHGDIGHIFFNMIALVVFGPRVESRLGGRRFLALYAISGIVAALTATVMDLVVIGRLARLIGASGATFGITLAFARYWPTTQLYLFGALPVQARVLVIGYAILSLIGGFGGGGGVSHFGHLGGFLGAWLYLAWLDRFAGSAQFRRRAAPTPSPPSGRFAVPVPHQRDSAALSRWSRIPREQLHEVNRAEVDRILEKITRGGVASLTPGERETLDRFAPP